MKCFDIQVIQPMDTGHPMVTDQTGVFASSRNELINLYKDCGLGVKIVREYEKNVETGEGMPERVENAAAPTDKPQEGAPTEVQAREAVNEKEKKAVTETPPPPPAKVPPPSGNTSIKAKQQPKLFSIAGIECKLENGKVYQKQWVKLLGQSASNYRIISDKNNKEMPLVGKHLEVLKWVLVEDEEQESLNSSIMSIING